MGAIAVESADVFRDYVVDGVPASGANDPAKAEVRGLFGLLDATVLSAVEGLVIGGAVIYATRAALYADLAHASGVLGVVYNDATEAYNGVYAKAGASGSGSWSLTGLTLPAGFAQSLTDAIARLETLEAITVSATGLLTGGGTLLDGDLAINAREATEAEALAGTSGAGIMTPRRTALLLEGVTQGEQGDPGQPVDQIGVATSVSGQTVPTALLAIRTTGWFTNGDGGAFLARKVVDATTKAWDLVDAAGKRYRISEPSPTPEMFGAAADGVVADQAALGRWRDYCLETGATGRLNAKTYFLATNANFDLGAIRIDAAPGAVIKGGLNITASPRVIGDSVECQIDSNGVVFQTWLTTQYKRPVDQKAVWLGDGDLNRSRIAKLTPSALSKEQVTWPNSSTWSADSLPTTTADLVNWVVTAGGVWHAGLAPVTGGDEISAVFEELVADYRRGCFVRTSTGYFVFYFSTDDSGSLAITVGSGSSTIVTGLTWQGRTTHDSWKSGKMKVSIRIHDPYTFSIAANGVDIITPLKLGSTQGFILDAGFGVRAAAASFDADVSHWSKSTRQQAFGRAPFSIRVFGDSKSSPYHGGWQAAMKDALDGHAGIRLNAVNTYAVAGDTSGAQWTVMQAQGLGVDNFIVINVGANDVQAGMTPADTTTYVNAMIGYVQAAGRIPVVVIPGLWYPNSLSGQGFATTNYEKGAATRAALLALAGNAATTSPGCLFVDEAEVLGPILADYVATPGETDARLRDNIHHTALAYRLMGVAIAQVIAGAWCPKVSTTVHDEELPAAGLRNSWTAFSGEPPRISVGERMGSGNRRRVNLGGILDSGTVTDGTIIYQLPQGLWPARTCRYRAQTNSGVCRIQIDNAGAVKIYDASGIDWVVLDQIEFLTAN